MGGMKVQVYGAGISGSFLYILLDGEFEVGIRDVKSDPDCGCAWGTVYSEAKSLYRMVGINFDDYVLVKPVDVLINGLRFRNFGIVTFDRKRLLGDIWREVNFTEFKADLVIDATGCERAFLPKIKNDRLYSTVQFLEKHKNEENLLIYARRSGYAWAFPLGDHLWHVGAGEKSTTKASELLKIFRNKYGFKGNNRVCSCRGEDKTFTPVKM